MRWPALRTRQGEEWVNYVKRTMVVGFEKFRRGLIFVSLHKLAPKNDGKNLQMDEIAQNCQIPLAAGLPACYNTHNTRPQT